jgi:hypothetical protein
MSRLAIPADRIPTRRPSGTMKTMAVVLEQPEHLVLSQLALSEPGDRRRGRRHRVERHQHRHRKAAVERSHAAFPAWAIRWCRVTNRWAVCPGRPMSGWTSATASSCRGPTASAMCAACSAALRRARGAGRGAAGERIAGRKRVLLALAATAYHAVSGGGKRTHPAARPDRRPWRAGPPAGAHERGRRRYAKPSCGSQPAAIARAPRATPCFTRTTTRGATTARSTTSAAMRRSSTR